MGDRYSINSCKIRTSVIPSLVFIANFALSIVMPSTNLMIRRYNMSQIAGLRIAMLGIGAMGSRIAQNLLQAGHSVIVYNRTAAKASPLVSQGAIYAATPRAAAEQADIVISMVTDDEGSQEVWLNPETGAAWGLHPGAIAIEFSTLTLEWTQKLATTIEQQGANFLEAPVVGSRPQAEAKTLIFLVGGRADLITQIQPILLSAGGAAIHPVGEVGQGMAMKLAVNAMFGIQVAALAELMGMLAKAGIAPTKATECLSQLPIASPAMKAAANLMGAPNHAPLFPIQLVEKDFRYGMETAQTVQAQTPIAIATHSVYQEAIASGYGSDNITGVIQLFT